MLQYGRFILLRNILEQNYCSEAPPFAGRRRIGKDLLTMIDLFYLKTFVSATKTLSFRAAAERNCVTQPAVSQHIQILEKKLGVALFERHGKKISITSAGKKFLPYAENILKQYEDAVTSIRETDSDYQGTIRVATIYSIGLYDLQPTIKKFFKKYPKINLHLEYHQNAAIYEMAFNRTIDFGLVAFPQKKSGIVSETFVEEELIFVQSPDRRSTSKKHLSLKDLNTVRFIAFSTLTPTGKTIHKFFVKNNIRPNVVQEYDNIELIKGAVLMGLGCAVLPQNTVAPELKKRTLETVRVDGFNLTRPLGLIYPNKKLFTKSTRLFYESLMGKSTDPTLHP